MTEATLSFPTMNSSDPWTRVSSRGRGHSSVEFPPEAASAFGSRRSRMGEDNRASSSGFPEAATSAFSKRPAASSAFGGSGSSRHNAVRFSSALSESLGLEEEVAPTWTNSAFSKKLAAAKTAAAKPEPPKKQTYEEMFPALGGGGGATKAAPTPASASAPEKKPTLASLLRKKNEEEEAAAAEAEHERLKREEEAARAEIDRHFVIGPKYRGTTTVKFYDYEDEVEQYDHGDDLDVDSYGYSTAAPPPKPGLMPDAPPPAEEEEEQEADEVW